MIDLSQFKNFIFYNSEEEIVNVTSHFLKAVGVIKVLSVDCSEYDLISQSNNFTQRLINRNSWLKEKGSVIGCSTSVDGAEVMVAIFVPAIDLAEIYRMCGAFSVSKIERLRKDGSLHSVKVNHFYFDNRKNL